MSFEVVIPAAGESVTSANVAQWHKSEGEFVAKGDTLVTLETDKVSQELEAEVAGVLHILIPEGEEVAIGTVVANISEAGEAPQAASEPEALSNTEVPPAVTESVVASDPISSGEIVDVIVPAAGESVTSANVAQWHVQTGSAVTKGQTLVTLETDKVSQELEAEVAGVLNILIPEGEEVSIGAIVANIQVGVTAATSTPATTPSATPAVSVAKTQPEKVAETAPTQSLSTQSAPAQNIAQASTPAGKLKPDLSAVTNASERPGAPVRDGRTTRKKMSMLRRKIASHLVNAQQTAAILTTFNEVDMTAVMQLRKSVQDDFVKKHGCKLGFMSLFVKAVVQALREVPSINGTIDGTDVIENHFYDIGVAVGTEKGLVVPVIRDCEQKSFADIERDIIGYAEKAREGTIQLADLQGGCFTISNGGVYGSLLSTPILNPPQSGILGMHTIQQRPVAIDGKVEIRPMMYLALSYDHRLVDGKEAVSFLIKIKDCLENPHRLMLEI